MKKSSGPSRCWQTQLPVDYLDTSLVQNAFENVVADLSAGKPVRLWFITVEQTNNGATIETIELEITINGTAYTWTLVGIASGTETYCFLNEKLTAGDFATQFTASVVSALNVGAGDVDFSIPIMAASVGLIRVRQTTDVDVTSAQIEVNIVWDRLEP